MFRQTVKLSIMDEHQDYGRKTSCQREQAPSPRPLKKPTSARPVGASSPLPLADACLDPFLTLISPLKTTTPQTNAPTVVL